MRACGILAGCPTTTTLAPDPIPKEIHAMRQVSLSLLSLCLAGTPLIGQGRGNYPPPVEGDFVIENFKFASGEILPQLKLHYTTIGTRATDESGTVQNAVLIMHGTT